jgi:hypothetical protein
MVQLFDARGSLVAEMEQTAELETATSAAASS